MKFTSVFVVLAFAVAANASILPLSAWGNPWGQSLTLSAPAVYAAAPVHSTKIVSAGGWHSPIQTSVISDHWEQPAIVAHSAHVPVLAYAAHVPATIVAAPAHVEHSGSYVAENRGSIHVASLPGHTDSVKSINVQPAPGTW